MLTNQRIDLLQNYENKLANLKKKFNEFIDTNKDDFDQQTQKDNFKFDSKKLILQTVDAVIDKHNGKTSNFENPTNLALKTLTNSKSIETDFTSFGKNGDIANTQEKEILKKDMPDNLNSKSLKTNPQNFNIEDKTIQDESSPNFDKVTLRNNNQYLNFKTREFQIKLQPVNFEKKVSNDSFSKTDRDERIKNSESSFNSKNDKSRTRSISPKAYQIQARNNPPNKLEDHGNLKQKLFSPILSITENFQKAKSKSNQHSDQEKYDKQLHTNLSNEESPFLKSNNENKEKNKVSLRTLNLSPNDFDKTAITDDNINNTFFSLSIVDHNQDVSKNISLNKLDHTSKQKAKYEKEVSPIKKNSASLTSIITFVQCSAEKNLPRLLPKTPTSAKTKEFSKSKLSKSRENSRSPYQLEETSSVKSPNQQERKLKSSQANQNSMNKKAEKEPQGNSLSSKTNENLGELSSRSNYHQDNDQEIKNNKKAPQSTSPKSTKIKDSDNELESNFKKEHQDKLKNNKSSFSTRPLSFKPQIISDMKSSSKSIDKISPNSTYKPQIDSTEILTKKSVNRKFEAEEKNNFSNPHKLHQQNILKSQDSDKIINLETDKLAITKFQENQNNREENNSIITFDKGFQFINKHPGKILNSTAAGIQGNWQQIQLRSGFSKNKSHEEHNQFHSEDQTYNEQSIAHNDSLELKLIDEYKLIPKYETSFINKLYDTVKFDDKTNHFEQSQGKTRLNIFPESKIKLNNFDASIQRSPEFASKFDQSNALNSFKSPEYKQKSLIQSPNTSQNRKLVYDDTDNDSILNIEKGKSLHKKDTQLINTNHMRNNRNVEKNIATISISQNRNNNNGLNTTVSKNHCVSDQTIKSDIKRINHSSQRTLISPSEVNDNADILPLSQFRNKVAFNQENNSQKRSPVNKSGNLSTNQSLSNNPIPQTQSQYNNIKEDFIHEYELKKSTNSMKILINDPNIPQSNKKYKLPNQTPNNQNSVVQLNSDSKVSSFNSKISRVTDPEQTKKEMIAQIIYGSKASGYNFDTEIVDVNDINLINSGKISALSEDNQSPKAYYKIKNLLAQDNIPTQFQSKKLDIANSKISSNNNPLSLKRNITQPTNLSPSSQISPNKLTQIPKNISNNAQKNTEDQLYLYGTLSPEEDVGQYQRNVKANIPYDPKTVNFSNGFENIKTSDYNKRYSGIDYEYESKKMNPLFYERSKISHDLDLKINKLNDEYLDQQRDNLEHIVNYIPKRMKYSKSTNNSRPISPLTNPIHSLIKPILIPFDDGIHDIEEIKNVSPLCSDRPILINSLDKNLMFHYEGSNRPISRISIVTDNIGSNPKIKSHIPSLLDNYLIDPTKSEQQNIFLNENSPKNLITMNEGNLKKGKHFIEAERPSEKFANNSHSNIVPIEISAIQPDTSINDCNASKIIKKMVSPKIEKVNTDKSEILEKSTLLPYNKNFKFREENNNNDTLLTFNDNHSIKLEKYEEDIIQPIQMFYKKRKELELQNKLNLADDVRTHYFEQSQKLVNHANISNKKSSTLKKHFRSGSEYSNINPSVLTSYRDRAMKQNESQFDLRKNFGQADEISEEIGQFTSLKSLSTRNQRHLTANHASPPFTTYDMDYAPSSRNKGNFYHLKHQEDDQLYIQDKDRINQLNKLNSSNGTDTLMTKYSDYINEVTTLNEIKKKIKDTNTTSKPSHKRNQTYGDYHSNTLATKSSSNKMNDYDYYNRREVPELIHNDSKGLNYLVEKSVNSKEKPKRSDCFSIEQSKNLQSSGLRKIFFNNFNLYLLKAHQ